MKRRGFKFRLVRLALSTLSENRSDKSLVHKYWLPNLPRDIDVAKSAPV